MTKPFVIWMIDEGSPGHRVQSRALCEALSSRYREPRIARIDGRSHFSGLQRSLCRRLMGKRGTRVPAFLASAILQDVKLPEGDASRPDLIVSSGGKSVFVGRVLANRFTVPFVFIGERKPYPSIWFHTAFTPSPLERGVNDVGIDLIPTGVTPEKVGKTGGQYQRQGVPVWAMIIGGPSKSHSYAQADWQNLAAGMNRLARDRGVCWVLTTSRRTGEEAESLLRNGIDSDVLVDAVWWAEKPEKRMLSLLGAANCIFVTQDSVTMVTECVASGKQVVALRPESVHFPDQSFMPPYLENLQAKGFLTRLRIAEMITFEEVPLTQRGMELMPCEQMASSLVKRLQ